MRFLILALSLAGCATPAHQHLGDCETCLGTVMVVTAREAGRLDAELDQRALARDQRVLELATTAPVTTGEE